MFSIPFSVDGDKRSLQAGPCLVFEGIPSEDDLLKAIKIQTEHGSPFCKNVLMRIGKDYLFRIGKGKEFGLSHESSFAEGGSNYVVGSWNTYAELVEWLRQKISADIEIYRTEATKLERIVKSIV